MMSDTGTSGPRLLLVEDEFVLAVCLSDWLEDHGAQVIGPVANVADALRLLEQAPEIDVAILDINLGGETAFPVADALRRAGVPFLFASGYDREHMPERFRDAVLCTKPIDPATVARALTALLQASATGTAARQPEPSVVKAHQVPGLGEEQPALHQRA